MNRPSERNGKAFLPAAQPPAPETHPNEHSPTEALLQRVWALAAEQSPHLAGNAAWELVCLLVQRGAYQEAANWLARVNAPPQVSPQAWPIVRQALEQLCQAAPAPSAEAASVQPAPAVEVPAVPPRLRILSLGRFQIYRSGALLPASPARKATGILRYLLTRRHYTAQREELMEVLWPEAAPRKAAHNLHVAVSTLRQYLDIDATSYLIFSNGSYAINPNTPFEDDCTTFQRLSREAERLRQIGDREQARQVYISALACYQGDYYLDDNDPPWAVAERERLLAGYLAALERLGRLLAEERHFEAALDCYQRLLDRDSYREDIHAQVMYCYWQLGRRGEAMRQYERCSTVLANELGLEPMQELQQLRQTISASAQGLEARG